MSHIGSSLYLAGYPDLPWILSLIVVCVLIVPFGEEVSLVRGCQTCNFSDTGWFALKVGGVGYLIKWYVGVLGMARLIIRSPVNVPFEVLWLWCWCRLLLSICSAIGQGQGNDGFLNLWAGLSVQPPSRFCCFYALYREAEAFLVIFDKFLLKLSLLSRVTSKDMAEMDNSIVLLSTGIGLRIHFLFLVNMTTLVWGYWWRGPWFCTSWWWYWCNMCMRHVYVMCKLISNYVHQPPYKFMLRVYKTIVRPHIISNNSLF